MRNLSAALLLAFAAAPLFAQEKLVETIEVRVVNVDVVVTDRAGKPVTGLTKADFQLFENGRPHPISNFYEMRAESLPAKATRSGETPAAPGSAAMSSEAPAELRTRRFAIFIDNYSLNPFRRNEILKSLDRFIDTQMRPDDEAELVLWTRSLSVLTPFTKDRKVLKAGIAALSERSRSSPSALVEADSVKRRFQEYVEAARNRQLSWQQAFDLGKGDADAYSDQVWATTRTLLEALRLTTTTLAGLEGRKVLVFAGEHLPENPGMELQMYLYSLFSPYMRNLSPAQARTEGMSRSQSFSIEKLARQANADGVTMYVIDAADSRDSMSAEQSQPTDNEEQFATFTNTAMAYQRLTSITGGVTVSNTSNFDAAFQTVARDLGSYYSLGYKPAGDAAGTRKLAVKTSNPAYVVRSRQTYTAKTAEETVNDRVVANIYHSDIRSEWPIEVHTGPPSRNGDRFAVPVEITLPATVTLLPQGEELVGGFTVYLAVGTDNGAMSKVTKSEQPIRIPRGAEKELRANPLSFTATIVVRPGESTLSVGTVDQISSAAGFARTRIVAR